MANTMFEVQYVQVSHPDFSALANAVNSGWTIVKIFDDPVTIKVQMPGEEPWQTTNVMAHEVWLSK